VDGPEYQSECGGRRENLCPSWESNPDPYDQVFMFSELEKEHYFLQEMLQIRQVVSGYEMFIHKVTE